MPEKRFGVRSLTALSLMAKKYVSTKNPLCTSCCCSVAQLCLTLCDPMDCSPPDCCLHGIFQVRIPEGVTISYSRGSSPPSDPARVHLLYLQADSLPLRQEFMGETTELSAVVSIHSFSYLDKYLLMLLNKAQTDHESLISPRVCELAVCVSG